MADDGAIKDDKPIPFPGAAIQVPMPPSSSAQQLQLPNVATGVQVNLHQVEPAALDAATAQAAISAFDAQNNRLHLQAMKRIELNHDGRKFGQLIVIGVLLIMVGATIWLAKIGHAELVEKLLSYLAVGVGGFGAGRATKKPDKE